MTILTVEQIIALHSQLIHVSGGMDGVRDRGLVEVKKWLSFSKTG